jgi:HK97 family phage prohead protease
MNIVRLYDKLFDTAPSAVPIVAPQLPVIGGQSPGKLIGMATTFNSLSSDQGGYQIRILPSAFTKSIAKNAVFATWMHDDAEIYASTKNGTLRLIESPKGLAVEIDVAATARGIDAYTLVAGGYVTEMSVAFVYTKAKMKTEKIGKDDLIDVAEVSEAKLIEVSAVNKGAMPGTWIKAADGPGPAPSRQAERYDRQRIAEALRRATSQPMMTRSEVARRMRQIEAESAAYRN